MRKLGFVGKFATLAVAMGVAVGAETARAEATTDPEWAAGSDVTIAKGDTVTLTKSPAALKSLTVNGTLTLTNWNTCVEATTIEVAKGGVVTCAGPVTNETEMSRVYLKCTDLTVARGGSIDASSKGYQGGAYNKLGYGPGACKILNGIGGAGHGGVGSFRNGSIVSLNNVPEPYGLASAPETAGSGGRGGSAANGGNGGGVIRVQASGVITVYGSIAANGGDAIKSVGQSAGSGGSVYLTCRTFAGAHGAIQAKGGDCTKSTGMGTHSGGGGRIAILFDADAQALASVPVDMAYSTDCGPFHDGNENDWTQAMPGTLYFSSDALIDSRGATLFGAIDFANVESVWNVDSFRLTNGWAMLARPSVEMRVKGDFEVTGKSLVLRRSNANSAREWPSDGTRWDVGGESIYRAGNIFGFYRVASEAPRLTIGGDLKVSSNGVFGAYSSATAMYPEATTVALTNLGCQVSVAGDIRLYDKGYIYCDSHPYYGTSPAFSATTLNVDATSRFDAGHAGYLGGCNGTYYSIAPTRPAKKCGGGHGGIGGTCPSSSSDMGKTYDSTEWPLLPGSGGHSDYSRYGQRGGGVIRVFLTGDAVVDGKMFAGAGTEGRTYGSSEGYYSFGGRGAGGTILLQCNSLTGSGIFSANGGYGYQYSASWSSHNGGAGGGGRIAVHYNASAQPTTCGITFLAAGGSGAGNGLYSGNGAAGTLWFTDNKLLAGNTTFSHKGNIYCPDQLASLTMSALTLTDGFLSFADGGFLEITGDVILNGKSSSSCGINIPNGYIHIGGDFIVNTGSVTIASSDSATARTDRFKIGGDLRLINGVLDIGYAPYDYGATCEIGGEVYMTNSSTFAVRSPRTEVEGTPGLTFTTKKLTLAKNCWMYPWSHNVDGGSPIFKIPEILMTTNAGFNASSKGYGRLTKYGDQYGPANTVYDGRGVDGGNAYYAFAPGHGGTGGLYRVVSDTYPRGRGLPYDDYRRPVLAGCGGTGNYGGNMGIPQRGGGVVRIECDIMHMDGGSLLASSPDGYSSFTAGSAGGSVFVKAQKFFGEGGIVQANGGNGGEYESGKSSSWCMAAGGGGRIAIWYANDSETATNITTSVAPGVCQLRADLYPTEAAARAGTEGTVYFGRLPIGTAIILR